MVTWDGWAKIVNARLDKLEEAKDMVISTYATETQVRYQIERIDNLVTDLLNAFALEDMQKRIKSALDGKQLTESQLRKAVIHDNSTLDWPAFWRTFEAGKKLGVYQRISRGRGKASLYCIVPGVTSDEKGEGKT